MHLPGIPTDIYDFAKVENLRLRGGQRWRFRNHLVQDDSSLRRMADVLMATKELSYDTETSGLRVHLGDRICGHAFTTKTDEYELSNWYVPIRHVGPANAQEVQLPIDVVSDVCRQVLGRPEIKVRGHHLKFDVAMARADGIFIPGTWKDTAIKAIINDENEKSFQLKVLTAKYVYPEARDEEDELKKWMRKDAHRLKLKYSDRKRTASDLVGQPTYLERFGYSRSPIPMCGIYACHDTGFTWLLDDWVSPRIQMFRELYTREIQIAWELHEMEWWGLPVDVSQIHETDRLAAEEIAFWRETLKRLVGEGVEIDTTPAGLKALFFGHCGMEPMKLTDKDEPSVDKEARALMAGKYPQWAPLIKSVDRLSVAEKIHSTYAGSWMRYVSPSHRVHSSYNQLEERDEEGVPKTGRLSSVDPNAQNVAGRPAHLHTCGCDECMRDEFLNYLASYIIAVQRVAGQKNTLSIRRYYTVPPGFVRAYIDLSQIELRVLAWFSRDPTLLHCYQHDLDVHQITADEVTGGDRKVAKEVNFGNNYGMTKIGLAKRLPYYAEDPERALADAEEYLRKFFITYAGIPRFRRALAQDMREHNNMFINPFGRPRRLDDISSDEDWIRAKAERRMMSSIISGTAADMLKEIMLRTSKLLRETYGHLPYEERGRQVQTIHDENVYDLPIAGCGPVLHGLHHCFTDWKMFEEQGVPIRASVELTTTTWENKKAIDLTPDGGFRWAA